MTSLVLQSIKREVKGTLAIALPLIASQLVYSLSGFVSVTMVAHLGKDALAASVLVGMIYATLLVLFFGVLNSSSVLVAHQFGAQNNVAISEIMGQTFILGIILGIIMIAILLSTPFFLPYTSQPPSVLKIANEYLHAVVWTLPGLIILVICEQFLAGINHVKLVLRISLLVVPIEIPIIYILIFGKLGLPQFGVAGIGYGLTITYTAVAIWLLWYLVTSKRFQPFGVFKNINKIDKNRLGELIRVGLPMGFMHLIEVSAFSLATFWIARFGTTVLAAHQILLQYLTFFVTIVFAMSQAVTVRVGHAVGRKDLESLHYAIYGSMILNFFCMALIALALNLFPKFFLRIDMNIYAAANQTLIRYSSILLAIGGILMLIDNFRLIGFGALRGLKDTKFPMYTSLIAFWLIGLPAAYYLGFYLHLQAKGIWWGLAIGIACGAILVFLRLQYLLKHLDLSRLESLV